MNNRHRQLINVSLVTLIVVCFVIYLRDIDFDQMRGFRPSPWWLSSATVVALLFRYLGVAIWCRILLDLGARSLPRFRVLAAIYAKAWMGRYVPGKVTWIAGKIYLAGSIGISRSRLAVASTLEAVVQITATITVSLLLVGFDVRTSVIPTSVKLLLVALAIALLALLHPRLFNPAIQLVFRKLAGRAHHAELSSNLRSVYSSFALYSVGALISGTSYYLLTCSAVDDLGWQLFLYIVGAYSFAGAVGMAVPLLPSGLGVRDGAQLVLLSAVFPKETALVLVVYSRLWSSLVDVLFYLLASAMDPKPASSATAG